MARRKRLRKRPFVYGPLKFGFKRCAKCRHAKAISEFRSQHSRRKKLTACCNLCRTRCRRTHKNPNTKTGKCLKIWEDWKKSNVCVECGTNKHIEADHLPGFVKIKECSRYMWWANNGGLQAQEDELLKCQPLCRFCHAVKTYHERARERGTTRSTRQQVMHNEKLRVGNCQTCQRKVTTYNIAGFDWAHMDRTQKEIKMSDLKGHKNFDTLWAIERGKCKLLCNMCHKDETLAELSAAIDAADEHANQEFEILKNNQ